MKKQQVLFLCTGNSARSQMAEALLRKYANQQLDAFSAGLEPTVINPFTVRVLEEIGVDSSQQYSKPLSVYTGKMDFDYLITVCSKADERCPVFPGVGLRMHWPFEDPAAFKGSDSEKTAKFRNIRNQIEAKILTWLKEM